MTPVAVTYHSEHNPPPPVTGGCEMKTAMGVFFLALLVAFVLAVGITIVLW